MLPTTRVTTRKKQISGRSLRAGPRLPGRAGPGRLGRIAPGQPGWGQAVGAAFEPVSRRGGTGVSFLSALNSCVAWAWSQSTATPSFPV